MLRHKSGGKAMKITEVGAHGTEGLAQSGPRVLMVIDDPASLDHHSELLRCLGYEVLACDSYGEGLAMLQHEPFDLVTVAQGSMLFEGKDVVMRALEIDRSVPVLVLARNSNMENYLEAMQLGAVDYLEMPVPPEEFMRVLRTHLLYSLSRRSDA
jgi:two-component system, NtrC family, phosphoglycerate transport system response regulator PgtA